MAVHEVHTVITYIDSFDISKYEHLSRWYHNIIENDPVSKSIAALPDKFEMIERAKRSAKQSAKL